LGAIFMPALAERELGVGISNDVLLYTVLRVAASANLNWWLGGVLSVVLLVPAVLGMSVEARARFVQGRLELLSLVLAHLALIALILGFPYFESRTLIAVCSILIGGWAGVRFGTQAAAWSATAYTIALAGASAWHVGVFQSTPFPLSAIVAWRGICLNVTITFFMSVLVARQRSLLAELTSFAAEYQGLFDALRQAVIVFERPSGRIVLANRAAQERFDCRPGDGGTSRIEDLDVTEGGGRSELLVAPVVAGIEREFRETTGETCIVEVWATDITLDERPARLCFAINVSNRTKLRARLMAAEGKARQALARDLHDGLGQALTGLALGVSALSRSAIGVSKALHSARFVERAAEEIQRDAERLVLGVSPLASANGDLVEAVRRLPETLPPTARGQLAVEITASAPVALTLTQCDHLYQLVREATNNAVKHARARRIVVHLRVAGDWVDATVSDDGIGLGDPVSPAGLGLSSMASRATLLRAVFSIGPGPRGGTTMSCRAANAPIATAEPTPVGAETPDARSRPVAL
jgi:signal transduction histidine kinase